MNLFVATFESVAVLLGIGIIGFYIIRKDVLPKNVLSALSPLALEIALPSIIFINIIGDFDPATNPSWWQLPLWWAVFTLIAFCLTHLFMLISAKKSRAEFGLSLFYQNGIFFPLAILTGMFQPAEDYVVALFLFTLFFPAFFFSTYPHFFRKRQPKLTTKPPLKKILHPAFVATLLALLVVFIGVQNTIPDLFLSILTLLGAMTVPLLMLILGGNIYIDFQKQGTLQIKETAKFVLTKNIIFPLVFLGIVILLKDFLTPTIALLILLQSAVPPLTAAPLVTERLNGDRTLVSQFLVASFLLSLLSLPLMVYLFEFFY